MKRLTAAAGRHGDKWRFLVAGMSTTVFSYLLYVLLLLAFPPRPAFAMAYVAGIAWAYTVNALYVFRRPWRWRGLFAYPVVYLVQGAASYVLFVALLDKLGLHPLIAPLATTLLLLPLTFLLSRAVVARASRAASSIAPPDTTR